MASKTLNTKIIIRNDISTNWATSNPTPSKAEICLETDTGKYKIGDGITAWADLEYYVHLDDGRSNSLDTLIQRMLDDEFGKVDDVKVNGESVVTDKIAEISISKVGLSNSYNDLDNKPDLSGFINKDVDNLTNYTVKTETGTDIVATIDSSTYVMTLQLKNISGDVVSTQTIDLPLEEMVIDADYDATNKQIILTLKNGTTVPVDVSDLISGLVPDTRKVNNKQLNSDITLNAGDVGALANSTKYAKSLTISGTTITLKDQDGTTLSTATTQDTTYEKATQSADGLMSKEDKKKLDDNVILDIDTLILNGGTSAE